MNRLLRTIATLTLLILSAISCQPKGGTANDLVGSWIPEKPLAGEERGNKFKSDGTFEFWVKASGKDLKGSGTYTYTRSKITSTRLRVTDASGNTITEPMTEVHEVKWVSPNRIEIRDTKYSVVQVWIRRPN